MSIKQEIVLNENLNSPKYINKNFKDLKIKDFDL